MMLEMRILLVPPVYPVTYRLDRTGMFCLKHLKRWCYSFKVCHLMHFYKILQSLLGICWTRQYRRLGQGGGIGYLLGFSHV